MGTHPGGLRILIVTPASAGSRRGNRVTALRWALILRFLGCSVRLREEYGSEPCDLMVALHALRSAGSIRRFRVERPDSPLVVCLTGTDLYRDPGLAEEAIVSLEQADRIAVLHSRAVLDLPEPLRTRVRVIPQTLPPCRGEESPAADAFEVCVSGHLRFVKDPFRAAEAARLLPDTSSIRVLHLGGALSAEMEEHARSEGASNPRYRWLGELPRAEALRVLARSQLFVLSSQMEGGANVLYEAIAAGVPVLATRIPGTTGIVGDDHPGLFPVGDTEELAGLMERAEADDEFLQDLTRRSRDLRPLTDRAREVAAWEGMLKELVGGESVR